MKFSSRILPAAGKNDLPVIVYNFSAQGQSYTCSGIALLVMQPLRQGRLKYWLLLPCLTHQWW